MNKSVISIVASLLLPISYQQLPTMSELIALEAYKVKVEVAELEHTKLKEEYRYTKLTEQKLRDEESQRAREIQVASTKARNITPTRSKGLTTEFKDFKATAYCPCVKCCGKWAGGKTKSGTIPKASRTIAVDPKVIPLGSEVNVNGDIYIAEDTGSAIKGNIIDIYFDTHQEALNWGRQDVKVKILR